MSGVDITEGLRQSITNSLREAIDVNAIETVDEFITFYREVLKKAIQHKNLKVFKEFIVFPSEIYNLFEIKKSVRAFNPSTVALIADLSLHLKEVVDFALDPELSLRADSSDYELLEKFYFEAFNSFNDLLYRQSRSEDWALLEDSMRNFSDIQHNPFYLQWDQPTISANKDVKQGLIKRVSGYRRRIHFAFKYWLYNLYEVGKIPLDRLLSLQSEIADDFIDIREEVSDLLFFRSTDLRYDMNWARWDYEERKAGQAYFISMPADWITKGFVIDMIKTGYILEQFNTENQWSLLDISALYESIKVITDSLKNNFEKWSTFFEFSQDVFDVRAKKILASITTAKKTAQHLADREIANAVLSKNKIAVFRQLIGNAWKNAYRIRQLFDYFGNIQNDTDSSKMLQNVGPNIFLNKGKTAFIEGDNHTAIYGLDRIGGEVGRAEDELFFHRVNESLPMIVTGDSLINVLESSIDQLRSRGVEPSVIIIDPAWQLRDHSFRDDIRYTTQHLLSSRSVHDLQNILGAFEGIPIFASHATELKSKLIMADFKDAFLLHQKYDQSWFDGIVSVSVDCPTKELVDRKLQDQLEKWTVNSDGLAMTTQEAKTSLMTGIIIDISIIMDVEITDNNKFCIGHGE